MIKMDEIKVTTYTKGYDFKNKSWMFLIEVVDLGDTFEAWIRLHNYGIAELMFGMPKKQSNGHDVDYDRFMDMVEANFDDYAMPYIGAYGEE